MGFTAAEQITAPAMFVFAHQDDELAYIGMLRHLVEAGRVIRLVWITDGAYSVPAEVRRRESCASMAKLGIGRGSLEFWDYPDGRSLEFIGEIVERLSAFMREVRPSEVFTVGYEGGHPDHDTAHFTAVTACRSLTPPPIVYEAPLYNAYGARHMVFNRFIPADSDTACERLSASDRLLKLRCILEYRSQFWITMVPLLVFAGLRLFGSGEPYRPVPRWNYLQPPHEGRLFYEGFMLKRMLGIRFSDFRDGVRSCMCV